MPALFLIITFFNFLILTFPKHLALADEYRRDKQVGSQCREDADDGHQTEVDAHILFYLHSLLMVKNEQCSELFTKKRRPALMRAFPDSLNSFL